MTPFAIHRVGVGLKGFTPEGAFGVLLFQRIPIAVSLERTYDELDETGAAWPKIPVGIWPCTRTKYIKGNYETFEIHVPGHTRLLFHILNLETESEGCVGVGRYFGPLYGRPAILDSGAGFRTFMQMASGLQEFDLEVRQ